MLGNFIYHNPTKLYFGDRALEHLKDELKNYGPTVQLIYGKGSIKKTGLYDQIMNILKEAGKAVVEDAGVMPNPTIRKVEEGAKLAREHRVDLLLAVGGGSVIDYAKTVSAAVTIDGDPWEALFERYEEPGEPVIPIGAVLTMVGTGSEMNGGSVITNEEKGMKKAHGYGTDRYPRFAILDPTLTFTVPKHQMVAGIFDIMSHILEQYFSGNDDNTSDYLMEGLLRSLIHSARIAVKNPEDYEARSNLMWTATWALNNLVACGKEEDWMVHMIGHAVSAVTDATHGMTLAAVSLPYYRLILDDGLHQFVRYAEEVWRVNPEGKTDREIAEAGLDAMADFMREIGVAMHGSEVGLTEDNLESVLDATLLSESGYRHLTRADVEQVLREMLA